MKEADAYRHKGGGLKLKGKVAKPVTTGSGKKSRKGLNKRDLRFDLKEGRVVSTERTVQGFETSFVNDVKVGDSIGVNHPTSLEFEERTVTSILSQRTLTIDSPFSTDLISTAAYFIRPDHSTLDIQDDMNEEDIKRIVMERKGQATGGSVLQIRQKKGMWTYDVRTEKLDHEANAEELLDLRIKHQGRDKYC